MTEPGDIEAAAAEFVIVQPLLEPWPKYMRKWRGWAFVAYCRWSCFSIGVDVMGAGAALHLGPLMIGAVRIKPQIDAFRKKEASIAARLPTGFALLDPAQFRTDRKDGHD